MKYTFQDSTELPVQRDFIRDLQDFIDVSKEVIPLERSAIRIKEENKEDSAILEKRISEIDQFQKEVIGFFEKITDSVDSRYILDIKDEIINTCASASSRKKNVEVEDLDQETKLFQRELKDLEAKMFSIMSPFFEVGIYGTGNTYSASVKDKRLMGQQTSFIDDMQYEFELTFENAMIKVEDFHELTLPIWSKGGIIHKEDKIKKIDVSDFFVMGIDYDGEDIKVTIADKNSEHMFIIAGDEKNYIIHYGDYDITGDEKLAVSIDMDHVNIIAKKLKELFTGSVESKKLKNIFLNGKNAMNNNKILECLKVIASKYGEMIKEATEKGYKKEEITIKIEQPDTTRTEKYISKSEVFDQISVIGNEGLQIAELLGVQKVLVPTT